MFLTLAEAAKFIPGADADTLKRMQRAGKLTCYRPGKAFLTTQADVMEALRSCRVAGDLFPPNEGLQLDESAVEMQENQARNYFSSWVSHARGNAKKRRLAFEVTPKFLASLAVEQKFKCAVSGIDFEFKSAVMREYRRYPFAVSVDRIDSDLGYRPGNVRLVCLIVNLARSDFGDEALVKMARAIVERLR